MSCGISVIKYRRIKPAEHSARMAEITNEHLEVNNHFKTQTSTITKHSSGYWENMAYSFGTEM
jgi:hypothetical protein